MVFSDKISTVFFLAEKPLEIHCTKKQDFFFNIYNDNYLINVPGQADPYPLRR